MNKNKKPKFQFKKIIKIMTISIFILILITSAIVIIQEIDETSGYGSCSIQEKVGTIVGTIQSSEEAMDLTIEYYHNKGHELNQSDLLIEKTEKGWIVKIEPSTYYKNSIKCDEITDNSDCPAQKIILEQKKEYLEIIAEFQNPC